MKLTKDNSISYIKLIFHADIDYECSTKHISRL